MTKKTDAIAVKKEENALGQRLIEKLTPDQKELIKNNFAKNASDDELAIYFNFCEKAGVDPLRGQAHFIKYKSTDKPIMMIGIDGFQARAVSDPRYEGMTASAVCENDEFSMNPVDGIITHSFGLKDRGDIAGAYAILKRKGLPNAVMWVDWKEYNLNRNLWTKKKAVMIVKVAKSTLLRREYPEYFSNVFTPEEFDAEITDDGEFVKAVDVTPKAKKATKQPKVVKPVVKQCTGCGGALPNDNESGLCAKCMTKPKIVEAEFEDADEETDNETDSEPAEDKENTSDDYSKPDEDEEPSESIKIKGITKDSKPRDALDKILEYGLKNDMKDKIMPIIVSHYAEYGNGSRHPYHIPEPNVIAIVKELSGMTLKKSEKNKSCKNKDCKTKVTEPESEEQEGLCLKCWTDSQED